MLMNWKNNIYRSAYAIPVALSLFRCNDECKKTARLIHGSFFLFNNNQFNVSLLPSPSSSELK